MKFAKDVIKVILTMFDLLTVDSKGKSRKGVEFIRDNVWNGKMLEKDDRNMFHRYIDD